MRTIVLVIFAIFMAGCENTDEDPILQNNEILPSFQNDSIYSKLSIGATTQDYLDAFVLDGLRHDVVIDTIGFRFEWYDNGGVWPQSTANDNPCNPASSGVNVEVNWWSTHNETFETRVDEYVHRKINVMWHEFGHSLLNLKHTCEVGQIMTGINEDQGCFEPPRPDLWTLELNKAEEVYNFQIAVDNLFKSKYSTYNACNNN